MPYVKITLEVDLLMNVELWNWTAGT